MLSRLKAILKSSGHVLYNRPHQLNIVGLRSQRTASNRFDDEIHVFYVKATGGWGYHIFPVTTDPGTFWLNNPSFEKGTAILKRGQYLDSYAIGLHRGLYPAVVQVKPVTVIRDYDRDAILDFNNGREETGLFGINVHRAESIGVTKVINRYSAGCQVFQNAADFELFMRLCEAHKARYGNAFTYTLIDFRALRRITWKRIIVASTALTSVALSWVGFKLNG